MEEARALETQIARFYPNGGNDYFDNDTYEPQTDMGAAKHGFLLSMYCLMRTPVKADDEVYEWAMRQTTCLGGDSDTNCAIVGGIVGAYAGVDMIHESMLKKVLECRLSRAGTHKSQYRPNFV